MKFIHLSIIYLAVATALFCVICCKPADSQDTSEDTSEEHQDPAEWEPEDPELIAGKEVYSIECGLCHNEGEDGAPRLADTKQWDKRLKKGLPTLVKHVIDGYTGADGEMPARAGNPDLGDEEINQAVKFMLAAPK